MSNDLGIGLIIPPVGTVPHWNGRFAGRAHNLPPIDHVLTESCASNKIRGYLHVVL